MPPLETGDLRPAPARTGEPAAASAPVPSTAPTQRGFLWRGWGMVGLGGLMDFIAVGFFFYSYSVFFPVVAEDFGISRSATSLGMSLFIVVTALASPQIARMLTRYPLKRVFATGALLMAIGLALTAQATAAWALLPGVAVIALGSASMGQIGPPRLVFNWFVRRRGIAMGFVAVGISLSGVVMPPVATWLIEWQGWRESLMIYAGFAGLVMLPLIWVATLERPEDVGLSPDGNPGQPPVPLPVRRSRGRHTRAMLANPSLWLLAVLFASQFSVISAVLTHLVPLGRDKGLSAEEAGLLVTAAAALAIIGKILIGGLSDHIALRTLTLVSIAMQAAGTVLIFVWPSALWVLVGILLFGLGFGGAVPLQSQYFARSFGTSMALAMGMSRPLMLPIQVLGPPVAGLVYDYTQTYAASLWFMLGTLAVAALTAHLQQRFLRHQAVVEGRR